MRSENAEKVCGGMPPSGIAGTCQYTFVFG